MGRKGDGREREGEEKGKKGETKVETPPPSIPAYTPVMSRVGR